MSLRLRPLREFWNFFLNPVEWLSAMHHNMSRMLSFIILTWGGIKYVFVESYNNIRRKNEEDTCQRDSWGFYVGGRARLEKRLVLDGTRKFKQRILRCQIFCLKFHIFPAWKPYASPWQAFVSLLLPVISLPAVLVPLVQSKPMKVQVAFVYT